MIPANFIKKDSGKKCRGIFGRIFGHKFEEKLVLYTPISTRIMSDTYDFKAGGYRCEKILDALATKKYKIVCTRCGCEPCIDTEDKPDDND
jgi:hypothetical protein